MAKVASTRCQDPARRISARDLLLALLELGLHPLHCLAAQLCKLGIRELRARLGQRCQRCAVALGGAATGARRIARQDLAQDLAQDGAEREDVRALVDALDLSARRLLAGGCGGTLSARFGVDEPPVAGAI